MAADSESKVYPETVSNL